MLNNIFDKFFNTASDTLTNVTQNIVEKNHNKTKLNHLKKEMRSELESLNRAYIELGKEYYNLLNKGDSAPLNDKQAHLLKDIEKSRTKIASDLKCYRAILEIKTEEPRGNIAKTTAEISEKKTAPVTEPVEEKAEIVPEPTEEKIETVIEPVEEKTEIVVEPVKEKTAPVTEPVEEKAESVIEPIEEKAEPVIEHVEEKAEPVIEPVEEKAEPVTEPAEEKAETIPEAVEEKTELVTEPAEEKSETVTEPVEEKTETVVEPIEEKAETIPGPVEEKMETVAKPVVKTAESIARTADDKADKKDNELQGKAVGVAEKDGVKTRKAMKNPEALKRDNRRLREALKAITKKMKAVEEIRDKLDNASK